MAEQESYTFKEVLDRAAEVFEENEVPEAERNARLLMQHLFKFENADLISVMKDTMPPDQIAKYSALVTRRLKREPLQYITRRTEFWSLNLHVDPRVLIPRQETEHIIEEMKKDFPETGSSISVVDVGTGSGNISVAIASEYSKGKIWAIDIDHGALEIASINASRVGVSNRVTFLQGDLLAPVKDLPRPKGFHVVVSNPPYIAESEIEDLQKEVRKYEPYRALVGGKTGYETYERLIAQLPHVLKNKGHFYLEVGKGQNKKVEAFVKAQPGLEHVRTVADLQGIPRVVVGKRVK